MKRILCALTVTLFSIVAPAQAARDLMDDEDPGRAASGPAARDWRGSLGTGVVAANQTTGENLVRPLPFASVSYRDTVYLRMGQLGVWLLKSDDNRSRLGIALKTRRGYDSGTAAVLAGMEERSTSIESGVNGVWAIGRVRLSAGYFTDISNKSDGDSANLGLAVPFRLGDGFSLTPSIGVEWLSAEVVDYYYGVRASEATAERPAYSGRDTVNLRLGLMGRYRLTSKWSLFAGLSHARLGDGIADSPIVVRDRINALFAGAAWRF